jgi:hypothetical protein
MKETAHCHNAAANGFWDGSCQIVNISLNGEGDQRQSASIMEEDPVKNDEQYSAASQSHTGNGSAFQDCSCEFPWKIPEPGFEQSVLFFEMQQKDKHGQIVGC